MVLVLSPTRELAIQTCSEMEVLTKGFGKPRCHLVAASETVNSPKMMQFFEAEKTLWMKMNE